MAGAVSPWAERSSPEYRLPWEDGTSHMCAQGNHSRVTHVGLKYGKSWDFFMWLGTPVHAARAGIVRDVEAENGHWPGFYRGNNITIVHDDASVAVYGHLQGDAMLVRPGDRVEQGQAIGRSGLSGRTLFPHLHFHVESARGQGMEVSFEELAGDGRPRLWGSYQAMR